MFFADFCVIMPTIHRMLLLLLVGSALFLESQAELCRCGVTFNKETNSCECEPGQSYDYSIGECVDTFLLYNTVDFCGLNANNVSGTCKCNSGFEMNTTDTSESCTFIDDLGCTGNEKQVNLDTVGSQCACTNYYYRAKIGSACSTLNRAKNPAWNDCPQRARDETGPAFSCICYNSTFYDNVGGNGRNCTLKAGYSNCNITSENVECITNGTNEWYFPNKGFKLTDNNTAEDVDECANAANYDCWASSDCVNIPNGGGYECLCKDNFIRASDDSFECFAYEGCKQGCDCPETDPCIKQQNTTDDLICVAIGTNTVNNVKFEKQVMMHKNAEIFHGSVHVISSNVFSSLLAKSLDSILGAGVSQVMTEDWINYNVSIITSDDRLANVNKDDVKTMVTNACIPTELDENLCYLPYGIVINMNTKFDTIDACDENPCEEDFECSGDETVSGRYTCVRIDSEKVAVIVLGVLLGLTLIASAVLSGMLYQSKKANKENKA